MTVKDKIQKTREFISTHQEGAIFATGLLAGITATVLYNHMNIGPVQFLAKRKDLQRVVDNGGAIVFESKKNGHAFALINSPF